MANNRTSRVTNPYINNFKNGREQRLIEDLVLESIKTYGTEVYYIPRNQTNVDLLWGEDPASTFDQCTMIEMYIKNVDEYTGQDKFLSKFGFEVREGIDLVISTRRWLQAASNKLYSENSYLILNEDSDTTTQDGFSGFNLEDGNLSTFSINSPRPVIGDLIYFPMGNKYFEINYVKTYEALFYQLGKIPFFEINCQLFEYSHEKFNTGESEIDDQINALTGDISNNYLSLESGNDPDDGDALLYENGTKIIYEFPDNDTAANNNIFDDMSENIVDWSEKSPFINVSETFKW